MTEFILCAAIFVETTQFTSPYRRSGQGPETGRLFCGRRHTECMIELHEWESRLLDDERCLLDKEELAGCNQGFITSTGRFVDREEAAAIAYAQGQVVPSEREPVRSLTSEDLY